MELDTLIVMQSFGALVIRTHPDIVAKEAGR